MQVISRRLDRLAVIHVKECVRKYNIYYNSRNPFRVEENLRIMTLHRYFSPRIHSQMCRERKQRERNTCSILKCAEQILSSNDTRERERLKYKVCTYWNKNVPIPSSGDPVLNRFPFVRGHRDQNLIQLRHIVTIIYIMLRENYIEQLCKNQCCTI